MWRMRKAAFHNLNPCNNVNNERAIYQAKEFNKNVGIDASILTKLDADAKGGAALSICFETKKPIIFVGVGQGYEHIKPFDRDTFLSNILGLD